MFFFFFNDTATTEIYTLSLHDALPISDDSLAPKIYPLKYVSAADMEDILNELRSEEHTSELQSRLHLVCRLLLEKKKTLNILADQTLVPLIEPHHDLRERSRNNIAHES